MPADDRVHGPRGAPASDAAGLQELRRRLDALDRRVSEHGEELHAAAKMREAPDDDAAAERVVDGIWDCRACGRRLGYYNREGDVLRVKYKGHITYVQLGIGGWVSAVCWGCGEMNRQDYTEDVSETAADG